VTNPHQTPYDNVLDTIGWTPLIRLGRVGAGLSTPVYGKAEYANPGGSVKDRIGLAIIEDAEQRGDLKPGGTIVEGTSGNTGVGIAVAAALKGYRCIFTMPDKMSQEKVRLLKAYGAEVVITPTAVPPDHPDNYVMKAKQIVKDTPGAVLANHPREDLLNAAAELVGEENVNRNGNPGMGSEDFSFMMERVPGAHINLGNGDSAALHNHKYDFNDAVLPLGATYWARLAETRLAPKS